MNRAMTVTQLSSYLKGVFDDEELLHDVTLSGEVTDISYSDKHTFLVLAEGAYSVRCVHFGARDNIEKGKRVALKGSVAFYDKRSSVSFNYTEFFDRGDGDKSAKLETVKKKFAELGYFTDRKQLPKYITDVVVVTSPDGAAIRDFMRVVYDKCPFVNIRVYPVKVQGEGAAEQICSALVKLNKCNTDAIVLCRGGGSDEDLDCFNDEELARAVALSEVPVISAVGHEINFSLCDYCAGTRAGTPSIAGEIVNAHALRILTDIAEVMIAVQAVVRDKYADRVRSVARLGMTVSSAVSTRVNDGYGRVRSNIGRALYVTRKRIDRYGGRLSVSVGRLSSAMTVASDRARSLLEIAKTRLHSFDPHRIFKIGYAAVLSGKNRVTSASELKCGQNVELVFADGSATADIGSVKLRRTDGNKNGE